MRILAIDYNGLFARNWHASGGPERNEAYQRTVAWVQQAREGYDRVALCCDSGHKSFRVALWGEYKANRPQVDEMYREQLRRTLERLRRDACSVFVAPHLPDFGGHAEGDDVIGALCSWATKAGHEVTIASGDKDVLQLARAADEAQPAIVCLSLNSGKVATAEDVAKSYGVAPHLLPELFALCGDKSDNYKPIPGVGEAKAAELLRAAGGSAVALTAPEVLGKIHEVVGDALAKKIREIPDLRDRLIRAKRVATILDTLPPLDFAALEAEPMYETPPENEAPKEAQPVALQRAAERPQALTVPQAPSTPQPVELVPYWAQPTYLGALWDVAKAFTAARCFPNIGAPEQVMVVGMMAQEDGIGLATAMQHAYFVHGRLSWSATYLLMRARQSGEVEKFQVTKIDDKTCVIEVKRKGHPARSVTWEWAEAERAGLTKPSRSGEPSNWTKWPKEMNLARCIARALRQEFRDFIGGRYIPEEMSEELPEDQILASARETRAALGA